MRSDRKMHIQFFFVWLFVLYISKNCHHILLQHWHVFRSFFKCTNAKLVNCRSNTHRQAQRAKHILDCNRGEKCSVQWTINHWVGAECNLCEARAPRAQNIHYDVVCGRNRLLYTLPPFGSIQSKIIGHNAVLRLSNSIDSKMVNDAIATFIYYFCIATASHSNQIASSENDRASESKRD